MRPAGGGAGQKGLSRQKGMLCRNAMSFRFSDPLALSAGAGARLVLSLLLLALLWGGVAWARLA